MGGFVSSLYKEPQCVHCGIGPDVYNNFLIKIQHKGKFDGLILCLNCFHHKFRKYDIRY